jgi:hypothetical protein
MPRKPSPKNLKNPLRILRSLCSEYGENAPLTQIRLAQITDIAPDYIRSLENSRRPLNHAQLDKIRYSIGAVWDRKRNEWLVNGIPDEPFTYEWFIRYRSLWDDHQFQVDIETHMLCRRLQELLQGVEASDYNLVFDRIYHALEEIRMELKVSAAKSVFEKTTFEIEYDRHHKTGEILSIRRVFRRADKEINRDEIKGAVGNCGYLDLTPYSSCVRLCGYAPIQIDAVVSSDPLRPAVLPPELVKRAEEIRKLEQRSKTDVEAVPDA